MPVGNGGKAAMSFEGIIHRTARAPVHVTVTDAKGATMIESTVLVGSKRPKVTVALDPAKNPPPYRVRTIGTCRLRWSGDAGVMVVAATARDAVRAGKAAESASFWRRR